MSVYHYCSLEALQSILKSQCFRLTNVHYMNDYREIRGFLQLAKAEINERMQRAKASGEAEQVGFLSTLASWIKEGKFEHVYCGCFSERKDDLGQWRSYADDGHGVAIGVDQDAILEANRPEKYSSGLNWRKVCYEIEKQRSVVRRNLDESMRQEFEGPKQYFPKAIVAYLDLATEGANFKAPEFHGEDEVRLIYRPAFHATAYDTSLKSPEKYLKGLQLHFRPRRNELVPYVEIIFPKDAVRKIVLGPCFGGSDAENSLKLFLSHLGIEPEVVRSRASYRSTS